MRILRKGYQGIAIIDPKKAYGEEGQYVQYGPDQPDLESIMGKARVVFKEIRYYYKDLLTGNGETIASQIIITEIPPLHIQPFHTHEKLHEMTIVTYGKIIAIDSETLTENDFGAVMKKGTILDAGDMVIEEPGTRHTIANPLDEYAVLTTVQTARIPLEEFPKDWKR